ncbi:hypothetical protein MTO96_050321, partial [Rhipicephalus appendiculatus]
SVAYAALKTDVVTGLGGSGGLSLGVGGVPSGAGSLGGGFPGGSLGGPSGVSLSGVRPGVSVVGFPAGGVSGAWFPGGYGVVPLYSRGLWGYGPLR